MARVALVGWPASMADMLQAALAGDGHAVERVALDADAVRSLARAAPDAVVLDRHPYVDAWALVADLRAHGGLSRVPVVLVGSGEPIEVPGIEVVRDRGRALDMDQLLRAVGRATGAYTG